MKIQSVPVAVVSADRLLSPRSAAEVPLLWARKSNDIGGGHAGVRPGGIRHTRCDRTVVQKENGTGVASDAAVAPRTPLNGPVQEPGWPHRWIHDDVNAQNVQAASNTFLGACTVFGAGAVGAASAYTLSHFWVPVMDQVANCVHGWAFDPVRLSNDQDWADPRFMVGGAALGMLIAAGWAYAAGGLRPFGEAVGREVDARGVGLLRAVAVHAGMPG